MSVWFLLLCMHIFIISGPIWRISCLHKTLALCVLVFIRQTLYYNLSILVYRGATKHDTAHNAINSKVKFTSDSWKTPIFRHYGRAITVFRELLEKSDMRFALYEPILKILKLYLLSPCTLKWPYQISHSNMPKYRPDLIDIIIIRAKIRFRRFESWAHTLFVKWVIS